MKTLNMSQLKPELLRPREEAERDRQDAVATDARYRRRKHRTEQILYRCTEERRQQVERLAITLTAGRKEHPVSLIETIDRAIDLLELHVRGKREAAP